MKEVWFNKAVGPDYEPEVTEICSPKMESAMMTAMDMFGLRGIAETVNTAVNKVKAVGFGFA